MRFNEIKGFEDRMLFVSKFTRNEFVQDFLNGSLYMNNFKYFAEQERKTLHKGQGDAYEGAYVNVIKDADIYIDDVRLFSAEKAELLLNNVYLDSLPLFSMSYFHSSDFEVVDKNEQYLTVKLSLQKEEIYRFKEDFKCDSVIFTTKYAEFEKRIKNAAKKINSELWCSPAEYIDFSFNEERHQRFNKGYLDILFNKDLSLKYQRELRYVLPQISVDQYYRFEVGDLSDIFTVYSVDDFLSGVKTVKIINYHNV